MNTNKQILTLLDQLKKIDLNAHEIRNHVLSAMGRLRIDTQGINLNGDFGTIGINSEEFEAVNESILNALEFTAEFLPQLRGKAFLVKKGSQTDKIKLGLIPKKTKATQTDMDDEQLPMVEVLVSEGNGKSMFKTITDQLSGRLSGEIPAGESAFKIHRVEEFAGWFPSWKEIGKMMKITTPLLLLTKKKTIKRIRASIPALLSDVLDRCSGEKGKNN